MIRREEGVPALTREAMHVLAARRLALGLRQVDVADAIGVSQQQVSKWEQGRFVTIPGLLAYCDVVRFDVAFTFTERRASG